MLLEKDLKRLLQDLIVSERAEIKVEGIEVSVRVFTDGSKISLTTPVYVGGNYIPKSVRRVINETPPFNPIFIKTFLKIDETHYQVILNYLGNFDSLTHDNFKSLLEDFGWLAEEWREFLEEHGKNDLVPVRVK
jgi:hypothetical protein